LPVSNAYFDETSAEIGSIDLILSSEVIEHIADPVSHIRLARLALKPGGLLLLTTPNVSPVKPGMAPELMPILSPGQHLVLFTPAALRKLLTENGFPFLRIVEKGDQIRVAASMTPFSGYSQYYSRDLYWQYLNSSAALYAHDSPLFVGFLGRLYKEFVHSAQFDHAIPIYDKLREHIIDQYHFDIEQPQTLHFAPAGVVTLVEFGDRWPFNLCAIWYCRGMFRQLAERDLPGAAEMFDAACRFGRAVRQTLQSFGADDGETAHLCREAELGVVGALAQCAPIAAVGALETISANRFGLDPVMLTDHLAVARRRLFSDLINLGHFAVATQVMSVMEFLSDDEPRGDLTSVFAFGLHLLNTGADPACTSEVFARIGIAAMASPNEQMIGLGQRVEVERLAALARFDPAEAVAAFMKADSNRLGLKPVELGAHVTTMRDRLLADLVNLGHLDHALRVMTPEQCLPTGTTTPAHLAAARAYGLHLLNDCADPAGASIVFAVIAAAAARGGEETRRLSWEAWIERLSALARFNPAEAVVAFEETASNRVGLESAEFGASIAAGRRRLLTDLVNLGHLEAAARLDTVADDREDWQTLKCLALIELLHHEQPATAAVLFEQAFVRARSDRRGASPAETADLKRHEVLCHLIAGDGAAAAEAARKLIGPAAEDWVPAEIRRETEALLKDHAEVLAQVLEG
jgi:SAM-dependent methyltransferase